MKSCFQCFCFHTAQILSAVKCLCCQLTGFRKTCQKIPKQVGEQIYSWALPRLISNPCWSPHYAAKYTTYHPLCTMHYPLCTQIYYISTTIRCVQYPIAIWCVCVRVYVVCVQPNMLHISQQQCDAWTPLYGQYCNIVNSPVWTILQYRVCVSVYICGRCVILELRPDGHL